MVNDTWSYLIFVRNAGNAVSVKFLAECKKNQKNEKITALGSVCRKFTHFPSVKFPGLKMCECKKNDKYQVWCGDLFPCVPPGAMGVVMGHELSHAFDGQGRQYDAEGNMVNTTKDF